VSFDFSSLFWIFIVIMVLQPLFTARWYAVRRAQAIRAIEKLHGTRVITMIHRQEKRSIFGFAVSRHIDLEDAQTIIAAIKDTPEDMPIDFVIHTPGGLVLAAMQIARALEAHKAKVTVYVPVYAVWEAPSLHSRSRRAARLSRRGPDLLSPAAGTEFGNRSG
jgi:ClpP class serine protease